MNRLPFTYEQFRSLFDSLNPMAKVLVAVAFFSENGTGRDALVSFKSDIERDNPPSEARDTAASAIQDIINGYDKCTPEELLWIRRRYYADLANSK